MAARPGHKASVPGNACPVGSRLQGLTVRPWEEALRAYLEEKGYL